jgi:LPS-assembly lipoprotein
MRMFGTTLRGSPPPLALSLSKGRTDFCLPTIQKSKDDPSTSSGRAVGLEALASRWRMARAIGIASALLLLTACSLTPLYGGGAGGQTAQALRSVSVAPIEGKGGWLLRNALSDRMGGAQSGAATYRLEIELDDQIGGFGLRRDDTITRERRTLRARYRLVESGNGTVVLDATAGSDVGIDVVSSEYATVAAENTALERLAETLADQITARIALFANRSQPVQ